MSPTKEPSNKSSVKIRFSVATVRAIRRIVLRWGEENYVAFPWRDTCSLWHGLIAEVLLQRTRAASVIGVYERFVATYPTPLSLAHASVEEIGDVIFPLGLKWRAPLLKQLGERLVALRGKPPETLDELIKLPAVGPYAAAAYLSFHVARRGVIIDANVVRWLCRMVDRPMDGETRRDKWLIELADSLTQKRNVRQYNYAILDFSMQICSKSPKCYLCPIGAKYCSYRRRMLNEDNKSSLST